MADGLARTPWIPQPHRRRRRARKQALVSVPSVHAAIREDDEGFAARERMVAEPPAAVITDLNMPAEHGLSLLSDLRRRDPQLATVLMTGGELTPEMVTMAEQYADAVMSKPCEPTLLVERLDQLLAARA